MGCNGVCQRLQPSTASVWQETFHLVTATNLPTSGVQDHKFEETMSMEARCVASLGFAYHDCEGAELMINDDVEAGSVLDQSDDETGTSNDISLFSERKREHGFNR